MLYSVTLCWVKEVVECYDIKCYLHCGTRRVYTSWGWLECCTRSTRHPLPLCPPDSGWTPSSMWRRACLQTITKPVIKIIFHNNTVVYFVHCVLCNVTPHLYPCHYLYFHLLNSVLFLVLYMFSFCNTLPHIYYCKKTLTCFNGHKIL